MESCAMNLILLFVFVIILEMFPCEIIQNEHSPKLQNKAWLGNKVYTVLKQGFSHFVYQAWKEKKTKYPRFTVKA